VRRILDPHDGRAFLADFLPFQAQIALVGALNGLAQTLLKLTAPGVPDTYQGCELWDLSLVDPDNRHPVDFGLRSALLAQSGDPAELLSRWQDGRAKQHIVARTLALRRAAPALFAGQYTALETTGRHAERLVAFARSAESAMLIVIVPRLAAPLLEGAELPKPPAEAWGDTRVALPQTAGDRLHNPLTSETIEVRPESLRASDVLAALPVALLTTTEPQP
jgi:(1->4)-alpha-D-glucan 1-alpha-D-glucosylmutase